MSTYPPPSGAPVRRPGLVTFLVVLVVIGGIVSIFTGAMVIALRFDANVTVVVEGQGVARSEASDVGLWLGIGTIVVGVIYLLVARGLARGSDVARIIVTIVSLVNIAGGVWVVISQTGNARSSAFGTIVFGALILVILYTPRANAFFSRA